MKKFTSYGAGGGAIRSISDNSLAAMTARIKIVVCFTSCLWKEEITRFLTDKYHISHKDQFLH